MEAWIARDRRGLLMLFLEKPVKDRCGRWFGKGQSILKIDFPSVTFENSPQQVEIKLIENEKL